MREESKPILLVFLNDVLGFDIKSPDQLTILNPAFNPDYADDKLCILDVRVQLSNRVSVDIEIQVINQKNIEPRAVYYVSQLCADQLRVGEGYIKLAPVFGLNLLCFDLYDDKRYYRKYVLKDKETNAEYPNYFEIDFFELRKAARILKKKGMLKSLEPAKLSAKEQWALFIASGEQEVYKSLSQEKKAFEEAYERLKAASNDKELLAMYRSREKAIRDWNNSIESAEEEGEKRGEKRGEERLNELYRRLIQDHRESDMLRAMSDPDVRAELYREYEIDMTTSDKGKAEKDND